MAGMARSAVRRSIYVLALAALALLLAATPQAARAQAQPLTAGVDRTSATTDDYVTFTVVVSALDRISAQPQPPPLDGFEIAGISSASQIVIEGSQLRTTTTHTYQLRPVRTGTLIIGPVSATIDGVAHTTAPLVVEVTQGAGQPAAPPPSTDPLLTEQTPTEGISVRAEVDNQAPFLGEQIVYIFRFYEAVDVLRLPDILGAQPDYDAPGFTGFWAEGDVEQTNYQTTVDGRLYNVSELRTNLFPTTPGVLTIDPAKLILPGTPYARETILQTDPVQVGVRPLPDGAPAGFAGAVGTYEIRAQASTANATVDEPVQLTVIVSGRGNLRALPDPAWPQMAGWRSFDADSTVETQVLDGEVAGARTYQRMLVPTVAGDAVIPPIEFSFFDPAAAAYYTATTQAIQVSVIPGAGGAGLAAAAPASASAASAAAAVPDAALSSLLGAAQAAPAPADTAAITAAPGSLALMAAPAALRTGERPLARQPGYWALWGAPLAVLGGALAWRQRTRRLEAHQAERRAARALTEAHQELNRLRRAPVSSPEQYAGAQRALTAYLSTRLDRPVAGLTRQGLAALLESCGVAKELVAHTQAFLRECEYGRFGRPVAGAPQDMLREAQALVRELDATLNPKAARQHGRRRRVLA